MKIKRLISFFLLCFISSGLFSQHKLEDLFAYMNVNGSTSKNYFQGLYSEAEYGSNAIKEGYPAVYQVNLNGSGDTYIMEIVSMEKNKPIKGELKKIYKELWSFTDYNGVFNHNYYLYVQNNILVIIDEDMFNEGDSYYVAKGSYFLFYRDILIPGLTDPKKFKFNTEITTLGSDLNQKMDQIMKEDKYSGVDKVKKFRHEYEVEGIYNEDYFNYIRSKNFNSRYFGQFSSDAPYENHGLGEFLISADHDDYITGLIGYTCLINDGYIGQDDKEQETNQMETQNIRIYFNPLSMSVSLTPYWGPRKASLAGQYTFINKNLFVKEHEEKKIFIGYTYSKIFVFGIDTKTNRSIPYNLYYGPESNQALIFTLPDYYEDAKNCTFIYDELSGCKALHLKLLDGLMAAKGDQAKCKLLRQKLLEEEWKKISSLFETDAINYLKTL